MIHILTITRQAALIGCRSGQLRPVCRSLRAPTTWSKLSNCVVISDIVEGRCLQRAERVHKDNLQLQPVTLEK